MQVLVHVLVQVLLLLVGSHFPPFFLFPGFLLPFVVSFAFKKAITTLRTLTIVAIGIPGLLIGTGVPVVAVVL